MPCVHIEDELGRIDSGSVKWCRASFKVVLEEGPGKVRGSQLFVDIEFEFSIR